MFLHIKLLNINLFPVRTFGSNVDRAQAKRLGQLASRLYIVLLIIGIAVLGLYTIIQPQTLTKTFVKPSLTLYNRLMADYNDALECPCSSISSTYEQFIKIEPVFHQVSRKRRNSLEISVIIALLRSF
jgi:hypothetical protein